MDIEALRAETPGCAHRLHLNNAGAALLAQPTLDAMTAQLQLEAEIGGYEAAGRLWDGVVLVTEADGFFELKRSRDRKPAFD